VTVVLRTLMAGPAGTFRPGERVTLDEQAERDLVEGGFAVQADAPAPAAPAIEKPAAPEVAAIGPPETAALPKPKKR
jgi:hypothetical protein